MGGDGATGSVPRSQAVRLSTAWACLRLRADLVSTMPIDTFRRVPLPDGSSIQLEVPKPPVMVNPAGDEFGWDDWLYASQYDLDSCGNTMGLIEAFDGAGRPAVIRLVPAESVTVFRRDGAWKYRVENTVYDPQVVWHERQFPVPGTRIGLSPIAHAALMMQPGLSAAKFAAGWFGNGATPVAHMRNTARKLNPLESRKAKARYEAQMRDGDVFVSGNDWEFNMLQAKASESMFLEQLKFSASEICRFLGVPGDMVDVETSTGSITYANITQRNLQLLIMNLNPALIRRERAFNNRLLPAPRYAKFNRGSLLQMDTAGQYAALKVAIDGRFMAVDEARELLDRQPLTEEQEAQFQRLFARSTTIPQPALPGGTT